MEHIAWWSSFLVALAGCEVADADTADIDVGMDTSAPTDTTELDAASLATDTAQAIDVVLGDPDVLVGAFQIRLVAPVAATETSDATPGTTALVGKVFDGPTPSPVLYHVAGSAADCVLETPEVPFCGTPCVGGALCVSADTCQDYPASLDIGTVSVTGLVTTDGPTTLSLTPIADTYQPFGPSLPFPAFAEGDTITLSSGGGALAPFVLTTRGIAPLVLTSSGHVVARETALALAWAPPGDATIGAIEVKLDISHHGGSKGVLRCTTDDDGALTIDATLITALVDLGYSGLPTVVVTRRALAAVTTEVGRVELEVSSAVEVPVDIPGLVSCTADVHCPDGQTCQPDLRCE